MLEMKERRLSKVTQCKQQICDEIKIRQEKKLKKQLPKRKIEIIKETERTTFEMKERRE